MSAIRELVFDDRRLELDELVEILDADFIDAEPLRQRCLHRTHKYGNDDDYADDLMRRVFQTSLDAIDGRPTAKGGTYRLEMLPTTCHVYFGSVLGATFDVEDCHGLVAVGRNLTGAGR